MKKVILVDDDFLVRSYLKMLSSWQKAGYEVVADVRDGKEALDALDTIEADLVITDISMPLMDGIQMIKKIRKYNQTLYIIVLSCHDDFDYVKDAMKEGADEYILKNSLNEDTLLKLLYTTTEKIEKKRNDSETNKQSKRMYKDEVQNMKQKYIFFNQLLSGTHSEEELEVMRVKAGIGARFYNSAVIVIGMKDRNSQIDENVFQKEQECQLFLQKVTLVKNDFNQEMEILYLGYGIFCCFIDFSNMHRQSLMHQILTSIASSCYMICESEENKYDVAVSSICIGRQSVRQSYQQARTMLKLVLYEKKGILYYSPEKKTGNTLPEAAKNFLRNLDKYCDRGDLHKALKECHRVVKSFISEHTDSRIVFQWLHNIEQMIELPEDYDYSSIDGIEQVQSRLENAISTLFGNHLIEIPEQLSIPVHNAVLYILQNYRSQIGLNEVAEAVGLNSAYLSYLFSQEMGVGFSTFLMEQRLLYAKKLLAETELKVCEIAENAGFNDYHYFSKAFKKACGMSAAEYRKKTRA